MFAFKSSLVFFFGVAMIFVVAKIEIPEDLQEYIDDIHADCLERTGLTEEDHKKFDLEKKDPKMMCYLQCLMKTSKWMNPDGSINYDHITENSHEKVKPVLVAAVNKCRDVEAGTKDCEKAYNFNVCLAHADPENWFFI